MQSTQVGLPGLREGRRIDLRTGRRLFITLASLQPQISAFLITATYSRDTGETHQLTTVQMNTEFPSQEKNELIFQGRLKWKFRSIDFHYLGPFNLPETSTRGNSSGVNVP